MSTGDYAKIGDTLWFVVEHFYVPEAGRLTEKEYCVTSGMVIKQVPAVGGMGLRGSGPDGYIELYYYKHKEIGKRIFRTPSAAALYAKELTEQNDRIWVRMGKSMRRTWEKYLEGE